MKKRDKYDYQDEYILIGGIRQYLLHTPSENQDAPVVLFLHGGPGSPESAFQYALPEWSKYFTIVHWDQHGSGKTYTENPTSHPQIETILADMDEIINYLKRRYNKEKIGLLGHSWGTVPGSIYVKKKPENIEFYIAIGQIIDFTENETVAYDKLREVIFDSGNHQDIHALHTLGDFPVDNYEEMMMKVDIVSRYKRKYKLVNAEDERLQKIMRKSPIFKLSDLNAMIHSGISNEHLLRYLFEFSLYDYDNIYKVPIYYILGDRDYQTPASIAQEYFSVINAPDKELFVVQNASHAPMFENEDGFNEALMEIAERVRHFNNSK